MRRLLAAFLLLVAGCCSPPPEIVALAESQVERWREVGREGRTWSDADWRVILATYAAAERGLLAWLKDEPVETFRFLAEEEERMQVTRPLPGGSR